MKLIAEFWELDKEAKVMKVGELRWDGKKITATNDRLNQVATQPIRPYPPVHAGQIEIIHPSTSSLEWIKSVDNAKMWDRLKPRSS